MSAKTPAFPIQNQHGIPVKESDLEAHRANGMTLRDYFAAHAMQGLLANPKLQNEILKQGQSWIESSAYGFADAMIEQRSKA